MTTVFCKSQVDCRLYGEGVFCLFSREGGQLYLTNLNDRKQSRLVLPTDEEQVGQLQAKLLHVGNAHVGMTKCEAPADRHFPI